MRPIRKRSEPKFWREFRKTKGAIYNITWMPKQELRESLVTEQKFLCCYCMARIEPSDSAMKVEHWEPQSGPNERQIDYSNLLGACPGGEGNPPHEQHCDTHKKNTPLHTNPAQPDGDCSRLFRYLSDGTIAGATPEAADDLATLNLNLERLKRPRKAILDGLRSWLERDFSGRSADASVLAIKAREWSTPGGDGKLKPFCQVAIFWLEKKAKGRP